MTNELKKKSAQIKCLEDKFEKLNETLIKKYKHFTEHEPQDEIQNEVISARENIPSKEDLVKQMLAATTDSIQNATFAAIAQFAAKQDAHEEKINGQFGALEDQLAILLPALGQHISIPEPTSKFPCNLCGKIFEIERSLQNHIRNSHNPNQT